MAKTIKKEIDRVEVSDILHDLKDAIDAFTCIRWGIIEYKSLEKEMDFIDNSLFFFEKNLTNIYQKLDKEIHEEKMEE